MSPRGPAPRSRLRAVLLAAGCGLAAATGCTRTAFQAHGVIASDGGWLGRWRSTPQGCSRDPFDGLPAPRSTSILTLVWEDMLPNDAVLAKIPYDAPLRLEISRVPQPPGIAASLVTLKTDGTRLDASVCQTLRLDSLERSANYPEGRPSLQGTLTLDCRTKGSHVTAAVRFERCEY